MIYFNDTYMARDSIASCQSLRKFSNVPNYQIPYFYPHRHFSSLMCCPAYTHCRVRIWNFKMVYFINVRRQRQFSLLMHCSLYIPFAMRIRNFTLWPFILKKLVIGDVPVPQYGEDFTYTVLYA